MLKLLSVTYLACVVIGMACGADRLYDFTATADTASWVEQSDTLRTGVGLSKAAFVIQSNGSFRRAVFFALLNVQENGAGFAGMRLLETHDLSSYTQFIIRARGQGQYRNFKVVLRHQGLNGDADYTFESIFEAPTVFTDVVLPFADFKPFYRGAEITDGTTLDTSQVSAFGLQFFGGVYLDDITQSGPATLEVDYIAVE